MLENKKLLVDGGYTILCGHEDDLSGRFDVSDKLFKSKDEALEVFALLRLIKESYFEESVRDELVIQWYLNSQFIFKQDKVDTSKENWKDEVLQSVSDFLYDEFDINLYFDKVEWVELTYTPYPIYVDLITTA